MQRVPCCKAHYGGRQIRVYRGPIYNHAGAAFFGDFFRQIIPVLTTRVLPYVGKRLARAGQQVAEDVRGGTTLGKALKKGVKSHWEEGKEHVMRKLRGEGKRKKRLGRKRLGRKKQTRRKRDFLSAIKG